MRVADLHGKALWEDLDLLNAVAEPACLAWRQRVTERMRIGSSVLTVDKILQHMNAARGHLATRLVMQGKLPALRKHMVECN